MKASYLINNIERSFEVWTSMPWGKDIPFNVFCEEILPYRLGSETLENWRDLVLEQYKPLYDSLRMGDMDVESACIRIFEVMGLEWDSMNKLSGLLPYMNYSMINRIRTGNCTEKVKYGIYTMRAMGIPVAWDYTPQWPFRSMGHSWASIRDKEGKYTPFIPTESKPGEPHKADHKMAKAFRYTFGINPQSLAYLTKVENIPPVFRDLRMRDVSSLTFSSADISFSLDMLFNIKQDYFFLAVFDNQRWIPIHWSKRRDSVVFSDMGKDIVYLPVNYENQSIYPCGTPFLFTRDGEIQWLKADTTHRQTLKLIRKHPFLANWHVKMAGGQFQGANRPDFADAVTLHTINNDPDFYYQEVIIKDSGAYRYCRYFSPIGSNGHIAEIEFYAGKGSRRINGKVIGTPGSYNGRVEHTIHSVFDGDVLTFFFAPQPDNAWVGMDFGKKEMLAKIRYLPRNDDNIIVPGQLYELFYWEDNGWVSQGQQTAADYVLYYDYAPANALFLLRNLTKGKEERIFTYENGEQIWW
jgi:hypothetical protein